MSEAKSRREGIAHNRCQNLIPRVGIRFSIRTLPVAFGIWKQKPFLYKNPKLGNWVPKSLKLDSTTSLAMGQAIGSMGKFAGGFWDRAQGKWQVRRICDKIFDQWPEKKDGLLATSDIHVLTLMVYNSINKQLFSPYKEPPSTIAVRNKVKALGKTMINRDEFSNIIMEWIEKDLRLVLANRIILASLAAPLLAVQTKNAGSRIPRIQSTLEKVPTPVIASAYAVSLILLQDMRMG